MVPCDNPFTMRLKSVFPLLLPALFLLAARQAESTPSFELEVSSGGVTHLAVGEKLQFRVYLPEVRRDPAKPVSPLASAMTWRVEPVDLASVNSDGLLTALRPGQVRVTVEAANVPKGDLGPGMPGVRSLTIAKELPDGRLPRLDGMPKFEGFTVAWDQSGYDHNRGLYVGFRTFAWSAGITTSAPPKGPLPWTLDVVRERSQFNDDRGYSDLFSQDDFKRWQGNLTSARLTIASWKDGIASGRLEFKTTRGVNLDLTFHAWVEDRSGLLEVAGSAAISDELRVTVRSLQPDAERTASHRTSGLSLRVTIANGTAHDIYLVDEPGMPNLEPTSSSLVLHWDVEDFPPNAVANMNIFPVPHLTRLSPGQVVERDVAVLNPVALSNYLRMYWDNGTPPQRVRQTPPPILLESPATITAKIGYAMKPFVYDSKSIQDERLAFMDWQRIITSPPIQMSR